MREKKKTAPARSAGQRPAAPFDPAAFLYRQSQERLSFFYFKKYSLENLADLKILDAGCGGGQQLRRLLDYGANPHNLYGIDRTESRIEQARRLAPSLNWSVASASQLPFDNASFDLVLLSLVMSAARDETARREISIELRRVLKPEGKILWFDFAFSNPRNRTVRGIKKSRVARLFPGAKIDLRPLCLASPLARPIAPRAYWLAEGLERLPFVNTHLLGVISFDPETEEPA